MHEPTNSEDKGLRSASATSQAGGQTPGPRSQPSRSGKAGEGQSRERSPLGESDRCQWCRGRTEEGGPRRQNCQTGTAGTGETGADPAGWAGEVRVSQWSLDTGPDCQGSAKAVWHQVSRRARMVDSAQEDGLELPATGGSCPGTERSGDLRLAG